MGDKESGRWDTTLDGLVYVKLNYEPDLLGCPSLKVYVAIGEKIEADIKGGGGISILDSACSALRSFSCLIISQLLCLLASRMIATIKL